MRRVVVRQLGQRVEAALGGHVQLAGRVLGDAVVVDAALVAERDAQLARAGLAVPDEEAVVDAWWREGVLVRTSVAVFRSLQDSVTDCLLHAAVGVNTT